jgi:hypothetical protein
MPAGSLLRPPEGTAGSQRAAKWPGSNPAGSAPAACTFTRRADPEGETYLLSLCKDKRFLAQLVRKWLENSNLETVESLEIDTRCWHLQRALPG